MSLVGSSSSSSASSSSRSLPQHQSIPEDAVVDSVSGGLGTPDNRARTSPSGASRSSQSSKRSGRSSTKSFESSDITHPLAHALDAHRDARVIIRLGQCQICSLPLYMPVTLPCGESLCRKCLPPLKKRYNISYPQSKGRDVAFKCPFTDKCGKEHCVEDCAQDIRLTKVLETVAEQIVKFRSQHPGTDSRLFEVEKSMDTSMDKQTGRTGVWNGGRLTATFTMAELGLLTYDNEVTYESLSPTGDQYDSLDQTLLVDLRKTASDELSCEICSELMVNPFTTGCGHTYCRTCLAQAMAYSGICPTCRRECHMSPGLKEEHVNNRLLDIISMLCPRHLDQRLLEVNLEVNEPDWNDMPIFICNLAYPSMTTFLRMFEPRYRRMTTRVSNSEHKVFVMPIYNQFRVPQGEMGGTAFMQYGTLLKIRHMVSLPNGEFLLETVGLCVVKITSCRQHPDGYAIGSVERQNDISIVDEECFEAAEVREGRYATREDVEKSSSEVRPSEQSQVVERILDEHTVPSDWREDVEPHMETLMTPPSSQTPGQTSEVRPGRESRDGQPSSSSRHDSSSSSHSSNSQRSLPSPPPELESRRLAQNPGQSAPSQPRDPYKDPLSQIPTQLLFELAQLFIAQMYSINAPWLSRSVDTLQANSTVRTDPARYPFWFASVLPLDENRKYALLSLTSVRERLKLVNEWIREARASPWYKDKFGSS